MPARYSPGAVGWTESLLPAATSTGGGNGSLVVPAPSSSATVTKLLVLGIGESGMVGQGSTADALPAGYPPASRLEKFSASYEWTPMSEPSHALGPNPWSAADGPGPFLGVGWASLFCYYLQQAYPSYTVGFIPCGTDGAQSGWWAAPNGACYVPTMQRAIAAVQDPNAKLVAILHEQGINDATQLLLPGWGTRWSAIETAMRTELGYTDKWYFARQHNAIPAGADAQWSTLLSEQSAWASTDRILVQKPEGPWIDTNTHLNTSACIVMAQRAFAAWQANHAWNPP